MQHADTPLTATPKTRRKLAAIMFADMAGYTAMMQQDEESTLVKWRRHRKVMTTYTSHYHGEILQFYGDGTLSIFESCIDAVNCAVDIQKACREEPQIPLRIGIHSGDILLNSEGIFGDGVNVASRIESISVPGAILISDKVYDDIKNHKAILTQKLGVFDLKHVENAVTIYAVKNDSIYVPDRREVHGKAKLSKKSIIVLPFVNLTSDKENEFFSDGITEEILNALTKVDGLRVMSRTSTFAYKGKQVSVKELGTQLQVDTVLEGSVRKSGNKVRITAQLIHAEDDFHFWSETFDRELDDIFAVQDEIALKIANRLRAQFDEELVKDRASDLKPRSLEAYQAYLKARHKWNMYTPVGAMQAIEHYKHALELDNEYFLALIGLTESYCYLGLLGYIKPHDALKQTRDIMNRAYRLKPNHYKTFQGLASCKFYFEWDWKGAERYFQEAMKGNPDDPQVLYVYAMFLMSQKHYDKSIEFFQKAIEIDPLNLPINLMLVNAYFYKPDLRSAGMLIDELMDRAPDMRPVINAKAWHCYRTGRQTEAVTYFEKYQSMTNDPLKGISGLGFAYARTFQIEKARACLEKLELREKQEKDVLLHLDFAWVYLGLKEYDKMFDRLELAFGEKLGGLMYLDVDPVWDEIRRFPRYQSLVDRMGK